MLQKHVIRYAHQNIKAYILNLPGHGQESYAERAGTRLLSKLLETLNNVFGFPVRCPCVEETRTKSIRLGSIPDPCVVLPLGLLSAGRR